MATYYGLSLDHIQANVQFFIVSTETQRDVKPDPSIYTRI
jgi:hypothetical protein